MRKSLPLALLASCAVALSVTACAADDSQSNSQSAAQSASATGDNAADSERAAQFPVTIEHAFGSTTIDKLPQRVATVGWGNHEVPLALGIVPVGMSKTTWGDDDEDGILPWVKAKLDELGGETPVLFDETDGIPYEQVAETQPDVILAAYSGLTQEDYDTLSKIAPVVAYPDKAWQTSMEDMVELNSKALGYEAEGEALVDQLDQQVDDTMAKYPDLKGKKALFTSFGGAADSSKIGFYTTEDPRVGFLEEHGVGIPQVVEDNSDDAESFWVEISAERPELFEDVDYFISYSSGNAEDDAKALADMQADPLLSKIPAVAAGRVAWLPNGPLGAAANQSPLSIPATIDEYFSILNEAASA